MPLVTDDWLLTVARCLGPLRDEVVFVGGAILPFLIDDPAAGGVRPTDDVDVIVHTPSTRSYQVLSERLIERGFTPDMTEGAPLCRWRIEDAIVDVMPTSGAALGFTNRWYEETAAHATTRGLAPGISVRVATAPYFLATKLEAFAGRGNNDFAASHDLEDIIAVLDGHPSIVSEVTVTSPDLQAYLAERFGDLLDDDAFLAALPGHLAGDAASQARRPLILELMRSIAGRQSE